MSDTKRELKNLEQLLSKSEDLTSLHFSLEELKKAIMLKKNVGTGPLLRAISVHAEAPGLIGDKVTLFQIASSDATPFTLLYLPGNNMVPGLRQHLRSLLSALMNLPVESVEVITTDEHTETGTRSHVTYLPVHGSSSLDSAVASAAKSILNTEWMKGLYYKAFTHKTRILNGYAWILLRMLRRGFVLDSILLISYIVIVPILTHILVMG
jgi:hypothetical protein